jgi:transposase, IS6 family
MTRGRWTKPPSRSERCASPSLERSIPPGIRWSFSTRPTRDAEAAKSFLLKALQSSARSVSQACPVQEQVTQPPAVSDSHAALSVPRVITGDKNAASPKAIAELKAAGVLPHYVELRQVKYRGNLIEQDHRLLKRLRHPRDGLFLLGDSLANRYRGFEGMNRRRKGQLQGVEKGDARGQIALVAKLFAVAVSERLRGKTPCSLCVLRIFLQHSRI